MNNPRTFHRPQDDRVIAGVSAAVARRLDVGVGWIRVAFVIATFFGGLGFFLYLIGWVGIPDEGEPESIAERTFEGIEGSSAWIGAGLMVLAGLIALSWLDFVDGGLLLAAAIFALGLALYRGTVNLASKDRHGGDPPAGPPPAPTATAGPSGYAAQLIDDDESASEQPTDEQPTDDGSVAAEGPPPGDGDGEAGDAGDEETHSARGVDHPVPAGSTALWDGEVPPGGDNGLQTATEEPPAPRTRSYLGRLTLAAMLIVLGTIGVLDAADVLEAEPRHYLGAVVLVTGAGLLVGSVFGRARGLIIVGVFFTPALLTATTFPVAGTIGRADVNPVAVVDLEDGYGIGIGELVLDLSDLEPLTEDTPLVVEGGIGHIEIILPPDLPATIDAQIGIGELAVPGEDPSGFGVDTVVPIGEGSPRLLIDADLGIGQIEIVR